jgi:flavin-binding protein dodecin
MRRETGSENRRPIERKWRPAARTPAGLFPPRFLALTGFQLVNRCRDAGAPPQRVFQIDGTIVFLQQIAERLVRQFLKVFHLIAAEKVELPPGRFIELHAFAGHGFPHARRRGGFSASFFRPSKSSVEQKDSIDVKVRLDLSLDGRTRYWPRVAFSQGRKNPMAKKQSDSVYRIIDVVGVSEKSWEDAGRIAVATASSSLRDLRVAEVTKMDMKVDNGKVTAFRTRVALSFKYEA